MSWSIVLIFGALACAPFIAEALRRPVTRRMQDDAPGLIADLPSGRTHYRWTGPKTGPLIVCIHGLSSPHYIFAATARALAALGFRVLVYDLYGRGYSDAPRSRQDTDFFLKQLRELLDHIGHEGPLSVLGYSMGGSLATAFAAEEGKRITSLVLLAPAGLKPVYQDGRSRLWTLPVLGDWLMPVLGARALIKELESDRAQATVIPDLYEKLARETNRRGYMPALLSSRRYVLSKVFDEDHRTIADYGTPVLAIWGRDDDVIPLAAMGRLAELNPNAQHVELAGATHVFPQTHPSKVAEALTAFLGKQPKRARKISLQANASPE